MSAAFFTRMVRSGRDVLCRFRQDKRGLAAIEFALILPLMLIFYLGTVEITQAVHVDRRLAMTNRVIGDLLGRNPLDDPTIADYASIVSAGISPMGMINSSTLELRMTSYGIDKGVGAGPRAFVDWQINCGVQLTNNAPTPSCAIGGTGNGYTGGLKRCDIDTTISPNVIREGTPLLRLEIKFTHMPILAGMFASSGGSSMFGFVPSTGFNLSKVYYTWPRANARQEGPSNAMMTTKAPASNNPDLDPSDPAVCAAITGAQGFKT